MENSTKRILKKWHALVAIFFLAAFATNLQAQNVTIKATNGSMVASRPTGNYDYDIFFRCGGFASWQHEQLNMVLTVSDATTLTANDQLANPANNLFFISKLLFYNMKNMSLKAKSVARLTIFGRNVIYELWGRNNQKI